MEYSQYAQVYFILEYSQYAQVYFILEYSQYSQVVLVVKTPPANAGDKRHGFNPWFGKIPWRRAWQYLQAGILAWRIPWTEELGGLQFRAAKSWTWLKWLSLNAQSINNAEIVSGGQQRNPAIHTHLSISPQMPMPSRLPHHIEQSSLYYIVGPCWWSILNTMCLHVHPKLYNYPFPPPVTPGNHKFIP